MKGTTTRIGVVCALLVLVFTAYAARLINLQILQHDYFTKLAAEKHLTRKEIQAKRGRILDRNGEELAVDIPVRTVTADCTHIQDPKKVAELAAPFLDITVDELQEKLSSKRPYVVIRKEVPEETAQEMIRAMEKEKLHGLAIEEGEIRSYPNGDMLSHVLGFVDHSGHGIDGVEKSCDAELSGQNGFRWIEHDRMGREIVPYRGQEQLPEQGADVRLTIDMGLQAIVENELGATFKQLHPAGAAAIFVDPDTGDILAMASRPDFDPNTYNDAKPDQMRDRIVTDMYEPGSVFKIVVASAAMNEGIVTDKTRVYCEDGLFHYGGKTIKDHHKAGEMGLADILKYSSNIGSAKMSLMLKDQVYYDYVRAFGFGEKSGIPLQGEITGLVNPPHKWDMLTKTRMAFGQSVAVTPIQMIMAMASVANGGKLMKPRLVLSRGEGSDAGEVVPLRQIVKPETAKFIATALQKVVSSEGTAPLAKIEGYTVAGKTGTAQKISPHGGYLNNRYTVSFAGFFPAEHPKLVGLVIVDDAPLGEHENYGGLVSAPVFARIGTRAAQYLDLPRDQDATVAQSTASTNETHR